MLFRDWLYWRLGAEGILRGTGNVATLEYHGISRGLAVYRQLECNLVVEKAVGRENVFEYN